MKIREHILGLLHKPKEECDLEDLLYNDNQDPLTEDDVVMVGGEYDEIDC